ncbi:MAG: hypothetical protein H0X34_08220 [Chthoniobacterales bacterium]|nr:hypothetical protein [Chthoniobacterales bacterium]
MEVDWRDLLEGARRDLQWETERRSLSETLSPAAALADEFLPLRPNATSDLMRALSEASEFAGLRILIDNCDSRTWPAWRTFLRDWATITKSAARHRRTVFCVIVRGVSPKEMPTFDDGLSVRFWCGIASPADVSLFASLLFEDAPYSALERAVAASVCSSLAQWDPAVVEYLRNESLQTILEPTAALRRLASLLEWNTEKIRARGPDWPAGQCDLKDGAFREHACVHALLDARDAIERLIWTGQLSVLLPFIEERRRDYVGLLRAAKVRLVDSQDRPLRVEDLEIGEIDHHVRANRLQLPPELLAALGPLKRMRDRLSHLKSVGYELLTHPAIYRLNAQLIGRPENEPKWNLPTTG